MPLEHAILGFLESGPLSGYDLKTRCFDRDAGHVWTADQAQVYRTLDRLEGRAFVSAQAIPQRGRPDRKLFALTDSGRVELRRWLARPPDVPPLRDPLLLRILVATDAPDAVLAATLRQARDVHQARLEVLRTRVSPRVNATAKPGRERETSLRRMALAGSVAQERASIDWLDDSLERISRGLPAATDADTAAWEDR